MTEVTITIPTSPESFATNLPDSNLRSIDFTAFDYETNRQILIEYVRTYYPNDFNDFVASNGFVILMDIIASVTDKLALRGDLLANEAFLATALSEEAVDNHLNLIGQSILRQTPATIDVECTINNILFSDVTIPAGQKIYAQGPNGTSIVYEVYKSPGDWFSNIVIPAGKRGVVAWGVQGSWASLYSDISIGGINQEYTIVDDNILPSPVIVDITYGNSKTTWRVITDPIQLYGPRDEVVEAKFFRSIDGLPSMILKFGDNVNGKAPLAGSRIEVRYRKGGGVSGRISAGAINTSLPIQNESRTQNVNFRNISASVGGADVETLREAKRRAPKTYSLHNSLVTANDYSHFASSFVHPYYGKIAKAAVILETSPNDNIIDVYVLAEGSDGLPASASVQLKEALGTAISNINVVTDQVRVKDGLIKPIDLKARIVIDRNTDARIIRNQVESEIKSFFNINNFELGEPLYISKIIEVIENIDGIRYVDLINPNRNIIPSGKLGSTDDNLININEIITLGSSQIDYYYDSINGSSVL